MNLKRSIFFAVILWIFIFIIISVLMFLPQLQGNDLAINIVFWIILIPLVLLLAKWYFKKDPPNIKKGFYLGVITLIIGTILDLTITIPFFVHSYADFYSDWMMWFGFAELLVLTTFAGFEFDKTFTKRENN
ncbi:MAG: hypothetical protein GF349_01625 [Candidatus Magasanikbacteria bacterium]|nr:hypothetical protein [Candidatus Magasanikbacteria bacterium]